MILRNLLFIATIEQLNEVAKFFILDFVIFIMSCSQSQISVYENRRYTCMKLANDCLKGYWLALHTYTYGDDSIIRSLRHQTVTA